MFLMIGVVVVGIMWLFCNSGMLVVFSSFVILGVGKCIVCINLLLLSCIVLVLMIGSVILDSGMWLV